MRRREGGGRRRAAGSLALLAATCVISACSSAVPGHEAGRGQQSARRRSQFSTSASSVSASAEPSGRPIVFRGSTTRHRYHAIIWASDTIRNCAAHAHGAQVIAFLQHHPCGPTHRVLATVYVTKPVDISSIFTSFEGHGRGLYRPTEHFARLEQTAGAGGIDDLLREGASMPDVSGRIPARTAFQVLDQDTGVDVLDAWYASGATRAQAPQLLRLEQDLFLSRLTTP